MKEIIVTTLHVATGALVLGLSSLLLLRSSPTGWKGFTQVLKTK